MFHDLHHQSPLVIVIITMAYVMIAFRAGLYADWRKGNHRLKWMCFFMVVFLFCDLSGYVSSLWPVTEVRWLVRESVHWILAAASVALALSPVPVWIGEATHERE